LNLVSHGIEQGLSNNKNGANVVELQTENDNLDNIAEKILNDSKYVT